MPWKAALCKTALGALVVVTGLAAGGGKPASAQEYPWCTLNRSDGIQSCSYSTYEQCAALRGAGGFCVRNYNVPDTPPAANARAQRPPRRR